MGQAHKDPQRDAGVAVRHTGHDGAWRGVELFTDANGALCRKAALYWAHRFAEQWRVCWLEEPVSSQDTVGLRPQFGGLSAVRQIDLSGHCAPAVSAHAFCAVPHLRHLEYFHTHVRVEGMAFDGTLSPAGGVLRPDPGRPGLGLEVKWPDLEQYRVYGRSRE